MNIYLSGTITPDPKHNAWRAVFHEQFTLDGHDVYDPMRFKNIADLDAKGYTSAIPPSLFTARDKADIMKSDVMIVVFKRGLKRQSIGTWWECGWADLMNIPLIVMTDDPDVMNHPFILKWAALVAKTPEAVIQAVRFLDKSAR